MPVIRRSGRSSARASATAPQPVPTSATRALEGSDSAASTNNSVSGRGIRTRLSTRKQIPRNHLCPRMYATGSRPSRRASSRSYSATPTPPKVSSESSTSRARDPCPSAAASSNSASSRGVSHPAAARRRHPNAIASPTARGALKSSGLSCKRLLLEPATLLLVRQRRRELVQLAHQDAVEVVRKQIYPMVLDSLFAEVVGADLLGPFTAANLRLAVCGQLGLLLGARSLIQACAKYPQSALTVLQLGLLVLHGHHDPGGPVSEAHGRVGRIDGLAARTGGPVDVDLEIRGVDLDLDIFGFG